VNIGPADADFTLGGLQLKLGPKDLVKEVRAEVCVLFNE
jgi:hypothetical protein